MIIRCEKQHETQLLNYLKDEAVYNTFMLADIANYGFDKEFQTVYGDFDKNGNCKGVYLRFYENLIVYSKSSSTALNDEVSKNNEDTLNSPIAKEFLSELFKDRKPLVVMGKADVVNEIHKLLDNYSYSTRPLYLLDNDASLMDTEEFSIQKGIQEDAEAIYQFLMSIDEMKTLYGSREMIEDRLKIGDGTHYFIKENNTIIGHANSAAVSIYTVMIGGVATAIESRDRKIASALVSTLCRDILATGKKPCLFSTRDNEHNLFYNLGFYKAGSWGVLEKRE